MQGQRLGIAQRLGARLHSRELLGENFQNVAVRHELNVPIESRDIFVGRRPSGCLGDWHVFASLRNAFRTPDCSRGHELSATVDDSFAAPQGRRRCRARSSIGDDLRNHQRIITSLAAVKRSCLSSKGRDSAL